MKCCWRSGGRKTRKERVVPVGLTLTVKAVLGKKQLEHSVYCLDYVKGSAKPWQYMIGSVAFLIVMMIGFIEISLFTILIIAG